MRRSAAIRRPIFVRRHSAQRNMAATRERSIVRALGTVAAGLALTLSACAGGGVAICEAAGGQYVGGTCSGWTSALEVAKEWCETHGGVFLAGQNTCAFGLGR